MYKPPRFYIIVARTVDGVRRYWTGSKFSEMRSQAKEYKDEVEADPALHEIYRQFGSFVLAELHGIK